MNENDQPLCRREAFFRRERRSVPAAREFTAQALTDWQVTGRLDDALVCVSEIATNALVHGVPPGRGYRLFLDLVRGPGSGPGALLRVEVHDSGPGLTQVRERSAGAEDEGGRGLSLVSALADKWGVEDRNPGKIVWCEIPVT
ncbi:ATP-binding protein [Streptomyces sp. NPDC001922]|uniref:ATP-binding protein n=1 Tax=Streptomyces sp. NPDC001922 TaxID=3364624 RepID=UPI0036AF3774